MNERLKINKNQIQMACNAIRFLPTSFSGSLIFHRVYLLQTPMPPTEICLKHLITWASVLGSLPVEQIGRLNATEDCRNKTPFDFIVLMLKINQAILVAI